VTLADVAPTVMRALGAPMTNVDGIDLSPVLSNPQSAIRNLQSRELYAESFAPLVEFGWAPLRAVRSGSWKLIAAPKPELFDVDKDPASRRMCWPRSRRTRAGSKRAFPATRPSR